MIKLAYLLNEDNLEHYFVLQKTVLKVYYTQQLFRNFPCKNTGTQSITCTEQ